MKMAPSLNFKSSKIVTILVGPSKASYTFHKDLLCAHSPFFEKCLSSSLLDGRKDRIELPEDLPEVFENFIDWTYREDLVEPTDQPSLQLAIHTYVFADKLRMPAFKNCVVTKIRVYHERASIHLDSLLLWRTLGLPDNLPLGQFLYDQAGFDILASTFSGPKATPSVATSTPSQRTRVHWSLTCCGRCSKRRIRNTMIQPCGKGATIMSMWKVISNVLILRF
jgi:hypothetical protein